MVDEQPPNRTTVRKFAGRWITECPCGLLWHSNHHRIALLFAVAHKCGRAA